MLIAILMIIFICILSLFCEEHTITGGASQRVNKHIVVDGLNVTHWLEKSVSLDSIIKMIDITAPILKEKYPGQIMYVLKDRELQFNDEAAHEAYNLAAKKNRVYIYIAERYVNPPASSVTVISHPSRGRDDFYMSLLAKKYNCPVITADKLRDFKDFRQSIAPFYVLEFAYWRDIPHRDYVRPESIAYSRLKKPITIHPRNVLSTQRDSENAY